MKLPTLIGVLFLCLFATNFTIQAQEQEDNAQDDTIDVVLCEDGGGCTQLDTDMTEEDMEAGLGDEAPEGDGESKPYVVCADGIGCLWTELTPEDIDLAWGDDGEVPYNQPEMIFIEDEVDQIPYSEEDVLQLQERLCAGDELCDWAELSPAEINALFNLDAEPIVPLSGTWLGESTDVEIVGCPASTEETGMLAGLADMTTEEIEIGDSFETSDVMDVPGATSKQPTENAYILSMDLGPTSSVRMVYLIVSEEEIIAHFFISVTVPDVMTCYGSAILNMTYMG